MGKKDKQKGGNLASAASRIAPLGGDLPDQYVCTGNFPSDFNELWSRAGIDKTGLPVIKARPKRPKTPEESLKDIHVEPEDSSQDHEKPPVEEAPTTYTVVNFSTTRPSIQCEFDVEETRQSQTSYAKEIYIRGWKLEDRIVQVLKQCMLERLTTLNLWNTGLNELSLTTLAGALKSFPNIKQLVIEGNPIPDTEPFNVVISEDNNLTHLSLRNNRITEKGAANLGRSLGVFPKCQLLCLNLAFNEIGDEGAKAIAKALRINRSLVSLSLSSNYIGDPGCIAVASSLKVFALSHEEIVERRKLISSTSTTTMRSGISARSFETRDRPGSNRSGTAGKPPRGSSKKTKEEKTEGKKGEKEDKKGKKDKKSAVAETPTRSNKGKKSQSGKDGNKSGKSSAVADHDESDTSEPVHPMLDPKVKATNGQIYLPGCLSLIALNMSRNEMTEEGLKEFILVVQYQATVGVKAKGYKRMPGLLKLNLEKNLFDTSHTKHVCLQDKLMMRDPLYTPPAAPTDE